MISNLFHISSTIYLCIFSQSYFLSEIYIYFGTGEIYINYLSEEEMHLIRTWVLIYSLPSLHVFLRYYTGCSLHAPSLLPVVILILITRLTTVCWPTLSLEHAGGANAAILLLRLLHRHRRFTSTAMARELRSFRGGSHGEGGTKLARGARTANHGGLTRSSAEEATSTLVTLSHPLLRPELACVAPAPRRPHTDTSTWPSLRVPPI
jgi:hypothetical protein